MTTKVWDPHDLAIKLRITLPPAEHVDQERVPRTNGSVATVEQVDVDHLPELVQQAFNIITTPPDRSADTMRIVGACKDAGLTLAQTRGVIQLRADLAARLGERHDDDVQTCWLKVTDSRQAQIAENVGLQQLSLNGSTPAGVVDGEPSAQATTATSIVALTDKGNAVALAATYGSQLRYVPETGKWVWWTGVLWRIDTDTAAVDTAAGHIAMNLPAGTKEAAAHKKRSLSRAGITDMVRLARSDPAMRISRDQLDANAYELNTPDGIVDLKTGEPCQHRADAWHTKITGVGYRRAPAPHWLAFLHTTFGGDQQLIDYMRRLAGYAALGRVTHHVLPFCLGGGDNGKSVLLDVFSTVLGDYAITAPANFLLAGRDRHETEIARLAGARLVVCSEIEPGARFDEAKVKQLTGGDKLSGRFMRQNFFDFTPSHTLFLAGNNQPQVSAGGKSFWRRLRLIEFRHEVPKELRNENLAHELVAEEGPAILGWIVAGAVAVLRDGLNEPESVMAATNEYAEQEDHIGQFLAECTTKVSSTFKMPSGQVYARYVQWCQENGETAKENNWLSRDLSTRGHRVAKSNGKRFVSGLMLDTPA